MRYASSLLLVALLSVASAKAADKRFYQVIDADGRVQMVEIPADKPVNGSDDASAGTSGFGEGEAPTESSPAVQSPGDSDRRVAPPESDTTSEARGLSDEVSPSDYVDSEVLDRSGFNPESRKRFYILDDGSGNSVRIEESDGQLRGFDPGSPSFYQLPKEGRGTPITAPLQEITDAERLSPLFAFGGCLSPEQLQLASGLAKSAPKSVFVDRKSWQFVGEGQPVLVLSVPGTGLRRLSVSSYSLKSRKPEFFMPVIAYADEKGCVIRASVAGYFDERHDATKTRHPRLSGPIIMLSSERYLLVVLPRRPLANLPAELDQSELGELLFEIGNNE